jgi:hypothetical protein
VQVSSIHIKRIKTQLNRQFDFMKNKICEIIKSGVGITQDGNVQTVVLDGFQIRSWEKHRMK